MEKIHKKSWKFFLLSEKNLEIQLKHLRLKEKSPLKFGFHT